MKRRINIIRTVNPLILIVFTLSLMFSIFYQIWFLKITEIFPLAYEIGVIIFNISLALIASSIFYFIVIHINEYSNKKKAIGIVKKKLKRLIDIESTITKALIEKSKIDLKRENYSKDNFEKILIEIKSIDVAPSLFYLDQENNNWLHYLYYFVADSQILIKEIYQFMPYLELDLLVILDALEDSKYFNFFKPFITKAVFTYPNLSVLSSFYYQYTTLIFRLDDYFKKINKYYS